MKYQVSFDLEFKKNAYPGKLIVVEGIDGSGKTTQSHALVENLMQKDKEAVFTKEPTDQVIGQLIREILQSKVKVPTVSFQYLFAADRQMHQEWIIAKLKKGVTIVSDRYFWSSVAYGMADRKENLSDRDLVAQSILSMYHQFIVPDHTFYLKISVDTALKRLSQMSKVKELYEKREKLEKITAGYSWLIGKFSKEFTVVDGERSVGEVTKEIIKKLE